MLKKSSLILGSLTLIGKESTQSNKNIISLDGYKIEPVYHEL